MANYVKFKQGLKKDFNTTNQPLTNGMIYFVIDENNNGSIYYDTIVDGKQATKNGTVHRVKFSGLPIKITGSVTGTGVISKDGETIEINTSTNHSHGLAHQDFTVTLSNDDTNLKWTRLGNQNGEGFWLKSIKGDVKAPAWFQPNYGAGIAFGGGSTKGIISVKYNEPSLRFAGGNGDAPVWYFTITGSNNKSYDLNGIGGHSSDSAKLDHNVTFKIASTADATNGANGTKTDLSGPTVNLYLPTKISGFDLLQASRFQGNADSATYATSAGYAKGLFLNPETRQEDMNFNLADAKYIKRVTYSMATSTTKKNKPPIGDANILSFGWDNSGYGSQLAIQNGSAGHLAVRGSSSTNGASSWGEWSTVLDSSNYTSYINNYYWANVKVSTASSTETKPTFNTAYTSNWWRSTGKTGWWNETYSGGITMEDKTYVKVAGNKSFLIPNGSLKIGGDGNIFFATGGNDATLKIYGQNNTKFGTETIAIQTCFDNEDPQTSGYTTQYANRCNLLLQPKGGQVYIGKNLTTLGDTGYKLFVDGNQWTSGNQWVNGSLFFTDITGNTADTGTSLKGVYGRIGDDDGWRIAGGASAANAGYLEIATGDDMNEPIYVRQYGGGGNWNGYVSLARTFTLLDAAGRSRAPELFEAKKVHVNSLSDQSVAIADIGYQFQVTGTSNFTDSVDISGVTTHHNNIQIDTNYSIAKSGKSSSWNSSHINAMIRMTSVNDWSPLLTQKTTNGYWVLGHYNYTDKNNDFRDQWIFGYLADSNLEGTTGASNSLTTTYRLLNIGYQRMFVSAKYNAAVGSGTQPVYVQSNGNVATCSYSLSATIEAGTANRMAYYKTANQIGSSGHYVTSSQVGINASSSKDHTFYVGGTSLFDNAVTINGNVHILPDTDVGLDAAGSLVIGNKSAQNMGLDGNEIMARNNSKTSTLYLNDEGGVVQVGQDGITIQAKASSTNLQSGGLRISSESNGGNGNVALELYRGNNGSWQIANEGAILYFRTNCVGDRKTTYAKNTLIIDNTTGSASIPYLAIGQEERNTTYGLYVVSSQSWIKNTLWTGNVYPDVNNKWNLGSAQYQWHSFHVFRDLNIYGNESTTDESHIKFNDASGKTQRAIITFNGNTDNGAQSNTHLKIATSFGAIKIKPANGYLDLGSGNDLHIQANTKSYNQDIIAAYDAPGNGIDLVIGGGATTIVGAGESAAAMYSAGIKNNENLYLSADGNVFLYTNCDTIANRRYAVFDTSRNFYPDADSSGSIGVSNKRWNNGYFNYLNIRGNCSADMAYSTTNPKIIFSDSNGAQPVGIVYTDTDVYRPTKGLKIMDVNNGDARNVWLEVQGDIWTGGNIRINNNKSLIQNQSDTSNYTEIVTWYKGGKSQNTYNPQIGQHNTGNGGTGSICILPYATATTPWSGSVGLFIAKSRMLLDNYRIPTTGNSGGTVGSATIPVYSDGGVLKTITSYSGNAATATKLQTTRNIILNGNLQGSASFNGTGDATITALNYQSSVYGGNTYNYPWHRIATTVVGTGQCDDKSALLRIRHTFNNGGEGLVKVSVRTNLTGSSCDISAIWLYRYNIAENNIGIGLWGVTGDNVYLDVYYKYANGWPRAIVESISNGRVFTLISSNEANNTTTTDKKTSSEVYTSIENGATLIHGKAYTKIVYGSDGVNNGKYVLKTGDTMSGHLNNNSEFITTSQNGFRISAASSTNTKSMLLRNDGSDFYILCCNSATAGNNWYTPTGGAHPLRIDLTTGYSYFSKVYGAVWNDYAEYRSTSKIKPGQCVIETGLGDLIQSTKRLQPGANIVSDTFGFAIGETEQTKTPIAVSGRVLAYPYEDRNSYQAGDPVCSGPNGTISKMTREEVREYPDRIIGTVSEIPDYEVWGTGNVKVNNRIWIKVK